MPPIRTLLVLLVISLSVLAQQKLGCYGSAICKPPKIDRLAAKQDDFNAIDPP